MAKLSDKYDQLMFNLPIGTKNRIKNLAAKNESMTSVILRAISILEQNQDTSRDILINENQDSLDSQDSHRLQTVETELALIKVRLLALENAANKPVALPIEPDDSQVANPTDKPVSAANRAVKAKINPPIDPVPSDRRSLLIWAERQIENGHQLTAIHAALTAAGLNVGLNAARKRLLPKIKELAESIEGGTSGDGGGGDEIQTELTVKSHLLHASNI